MLAFDLLEGFRGFSNAVDQRIHRLVVKIVDRLLDRLVAGLPQ
jgi:hypothetical protein